MHPGDDRISGRNEQEIDDVLTPFVDNTEAQLVAESSPQSGRERLSGMLAGLLPESVRYRWLDVTIEPATTEVRAGDPVAFEVTISNRAPVSIPASLTCTALWGWYLDSRPEAETRTPYTGPAHRVHLRGSQSYTFERRWSGYVGTDNGYECPDLGTHTLAVRLHVAERYADGLMDRVKLTVRPSR